jgi:hypothetical protein
MATAVPAERPLATGLKHLGLSMAALLALSGVSAGLVQTLGDAEDAGPRVSVEINRYQPPVARTPGESAAAGDSVAESAPPGISGWFPWSQGGGMSRWMPGTPAPPAPDVAAIDSAAKAALGKGPTAPTVTGPASAASAGAAPVTGEARIMAPAFGRADAASEIDPTGGVRVIRGGARSAPLARAPLPGIHEQGPGGLLPVVAADGRSAFSAYRRPFTDTGRPKVALVVGGLGLNARITERAIEDLPGEVTLSFVPYAENLQGWIDRARANGHEVLIEIPMEPFDFPQNDTGPHTLLAAAPADENARRLEYLLSRATGYFGVTNYLGGRFAQAGEATTAAMGLLKRRGVGFVSDGSTSALGVAAQSSGLRAVSADRAIDQRPSASDVTSQLGALEAQAGQRGAALGFGVGYAVTIETVARWSRELERKGLQLAPASALMQ